MSETDERLNPPGSRLRFTLRDLLWLIVVAALCIGYWHERTRNAPRPYDVYLSDDGTTLRIVNNESGIVLSMPSDNLDSKSLLQKMAAPP